MLQIKNLTLLRDSASDGACNKPSLNSIGQKLFEKSHGNHFSKIPGLGCLVIFPFYDMLETADANAVYGTW